MEKSRHYALSLKDDLQIYKFNESLVDQVNPLGQDPSQPESIFWAPDS